MKCHFLHLGCLAILVIVHAAQPAPSLNRNQQVQKNCYDNSIKLQAELGMDDNTEDKDGGGGGDDDEDTGDTANAVEHFGHFLNRFGEKIHKNRNKIFGDAKNFNDETYLLAVLLQGIAGDDKAEAESLLGGLKTLGKNIYKNQIRDTAKGIKNTSRRIWKLIG